MADRRQDLFTLFRNTAALARPQGYAFVGARLSAALSCAGGRGAAAGAPPWQDVEVAVSLLYQLGEAAPETDMRPGSGVLAQLAAGVMQASGGRRRRNVGAARCCTSACLLPLARLHGLPLAGLEPGCGGHPPLPRCDSATPRPPAWHRPRAQADVPAAKHRLVALALLETYVRYSRVAAAAGGALLAAVAQRFLDGHGMGHPCEAVSRRAAYLLCRLAKQLRGSLRPLLPDILQVGGWLVVEVVGWWGWWWRWWGWWWR